jgi:hypothetical protein
MTEKRRPRRGRKGEDGSDGQDQWLDNLIVGDTDLTAPGNKMWVQEDNIFRKAEILEKKSDNTIVVKFEDDNDVCVLCFNMLRKKLFNSETFNQ